MRSTSWLVVLWAFACGPEAPPPAPPPPPPPPPPTAPPPAPIDGAACEAPVAHGEPVGVFTGRMGPSNLLTVHLFRPAVGDDGVAPEGMVGWGDLSVGQLDTLLDLDTRNAVPDPGGVCVRATGLGRVDATGGAVRLVDMTLRGDLTAEVAKAIWATPELQPFLDGEKNRLVPGYTPAAAGTAYLLVRLGQSGDHGFPVALEPGKALRGDAVVSLVDDRGMAIYETVTMR